MNSYQFLRRTTAEALYLALRDDPYYIALESSASNDLAQAKEAMLCYYDYSMMEGYRYGELVVAENEAAGVSVWSKPVDDELAAQISFEKKTFLLQDMGSDSLRVYQEITAFMAEKSEGVVPKTSWYLSIVGLAPGYQRQGLGSSLLAPVLAKTDALGLPTYLETFTLQNISFYRRLGYQECASFVEPMTACEYWVLLREPG